MKLLATLSLTVTLAVLPGMARAEHGPTTVSNVDELVRALRYNLEGLAGGYFLEPGEVPNFDDPRFNRLVGAARIAVDRAGRQLDAGRTSGGLRWLNLSVLILDRATRIAIDSGRSSAGFSDDLASYTRALVEFFTEDLLAIAAEADHVPPIVLMIAAALEERGDSLKRSDEGDWSRSTRHYTAASLLVLRFLCTPSNPGP